MTKITVFLIFASQLCAAPAFAVYQDPYEYHAVLPTDCDEVRGMMNLKTSRMEYFYINTCNRAHFWQYSQLRGVKTVKDYVIHVPAQALEGDRRIGGFYCSKYPNFKVSRVWSCQSSGWVPRK